MAQDIIISDSTLTGHPEYIRDAINVGYGSDISSRVLIIAESFNSALERCRDMGGIAVIRSFSGVSSYITSALTFYKNYGIQSFWPLGSNSPIYLASPNYIPVMTTCGASSGSVNIAAYGPGLEFIDDDADGIPEIGASSYSNGVILGKILKIKDTLGCTWWEARYRARMTTNQLGSWSVNNGYGIINVTSATLFTGSIIADPYMSQFITGSVGAIAGALKFKGGLYASKPPLEDREIFIDTSNKRLIVVIGEHEYYADLTLLT